MSKPSIPPPAPGYWRTSLASAKKGGWKNATLGRLPSPPCYFTFVQKQLSEQEEKVGGCWLAHLELQNSVSSRYQRAGSTFWSAQHGLLFPHLPWKWNSKKFVSAVTKYSFVDIMDLTWRRKPTANTVRKSTCLKVTPRDTRRWESRE